MIKAVIFDLDGVLVDSFETSIKIFQKAMKEAGYKPPTRAYINKIYYHTLFNTVSLLTNSSSKKEIERVMKIIHSHDYSDVKFPNGMTATLKKLSGSYRLAVASSSGSSRVITLLKKANSLEYFSAIIGSDDHTNPKPHPEPLLIAAKRLGVKPAEAVYIGDRETDIEAAEAAGMKSIGYLEFVDHGLPAADLTTDRFDKIPGVIKRLEK